MFARVLVDWMAVVGFAPHRPVLWAFNSTTLTDMDVGQTKNDGIFRIGADSVGIVDSNPEIIWTALAIATRVGFLVQESNAFGNRSAATGRKYHAGSRKNGRSHTQ
jgi:hypothetical protein